MQVKETPTEKESKWKQNLRNMGYLINIYWHGVCTYQRNVILFYCVLFWYCQQPESKVSALVPSDISHVLIKGRWVWPSWVTSLQMELLNFGNLLTPNSALKRWKILSTSWLNLWQSLSEEIEKERDKAFLLPHSSFWSPQQNKPRERLKGDENSQLGYYFFSQRMT